MGDAHPTLKIGDSVRGLSLPSTDGTFIGLAELVGKPLVLFYYLKDGGEACTKEVLGFRDLYPQFRELGVNVVGVGVEPHASHRQFAEAQGLPFPLLSDADSKFAASVGALARVEVNGVPATLPRRITYLTDVFYRVVNVYEDVDPATHAAQVLADARAFVTREEPRDVVEHAPVLLVPNAFPADLCRRLIELWEAGGNEDSGFMVQEEGKTVGKTDYSHKIRRDHYMKPGPLEEEVKGYVAGRVIPMIGHAFNFRVTRREDFRIACYDASRGGYFRPHRDNTTDGTRHRRFALSLLLNEDYEGGYLRFPEYGRHRYRPAAGGAVVFSCSLLHEATDVTAGRRFVLLSFFYGEQEAKLRDEYNRRIGGTYRA